MKMKTTKTPKKGFQPFDLTITVESEQEFSNLFSLSYVMGYELEDIIRPLSVGMNELPPPFPSQIGDFLDDLAITLERAYEEDNEC